MGAMASQITSLTIVYSTVYSGADQRKHQSSASLAFVWGIHRGPVNSRHKWPVTRKMFHLILSSWIQHEMRSDTSIYLVWIIIFNSYYEYGVVKIIYKSWTLIVGHFMWNRVNLFVVYRNNLLTKQSTNHYATLPKKISLHWKVTEFMHATANVAAQYDLCTRQRDCVSSNMGLS